MKFVIQEHNSSKGGPRYYLRLEKDGVLKGWAVPKGLPEMGGKQRLAIEVGPFRLSAIGYEGKVGKSRYGPGMISVWDRGECRLHSWLEDKITFKLSSSRVKGEFSLIRFPKSGPLHWLLSQPNSSPSQALYVKPPETAINNPDKRSDVRLVKKAPESEPSRGNKRAPFESLPVKSHPAPKLRKQKKLITGRPIQKPRPKTRPVKARARKPADKSDKKRKAFSRWKIYLARIRGGRRLLKRNKSSFSPSYSGADWLWFFVFLIAGLVLVVVLILMFGAG